MSSATVLFCHGLESGPHGSKFKALEAAGYCVKSPDCRALRTLDQRVQVIAPLLRELSPLTVGSSFGGVTAVVAAIKTQQRLPGIVLCAPALNMAPWVEDHLLAYPITIVHGTMDDVIPIEYSRRYAAKTKAKLIEVEDDHRLHNSMDVILDAVSQLK